MDFNQIWREAFPLYPHSSLWIWAKSEDLKISPLYLVKIFSVKNLLSTIFTPCAQNISKIITRMNYHTLWDIDYTHIGSLNEPIFMFLVHRPSM